MKNENKRDLILEFIFQKYITGADIESACEGLIKKSNSEERKKILKNCLNLFRAADTQQKIEELQEAEKPLNNADFVKLLLVTFAERIFEHNKRQYDMSNNYTGKRIQSITQPNGTVRKDIDFEKNNTKTEADFVLPLDNNDMIIFTNIGKLTCTTQPFVKSKNVNKFNVTFIASNGNKRTDTVFTNIDFKKFSDKSYLRAVLEELFSKKNIEQSNCCGYIGEILPSTYFVDKIRIGEQSNYFESYLGQGSRYKFSPNYELVYDFDTLEAVVDYTHEQEKQQEEKRKDRKHYSNWFMDL